MAKREVFVAREALTAGTLTRSELARWHQPLFRGVYVAASGLYGANWVDAGAPIELISARHVRPQPGLIVRQEALAPDEATKVAGLPVVVRARAAFDLGRHLPRGEAVARLDALMRNCVFRADDVLALAARYPGARGLKQLAAVLPLVDGGAASPQETRVRLLYVDAGLPRAATQFGCSIWGGKAFGSVPSTTATCIAPTVARTSRTCACAANWKASGGRLITSSKKTATTRSSGVPSDC
jgi:hypothetical protein